MFQTFFTVIGPALLMAGVGGAALLGMWSYVVHKAIPRAELARAEAKRVERQNEYVADAECFVDDLVCEYDGNVLLRDSLTEDLSSRLFALENFHDQDETPQPIRARRRARADGPLRRRENG